MQFIYSNDQVDNVISHESLSLISNSLLAIFVYQGDLKHLHNCKHRKTRAYTNWHGIRYRLNQYLHFIPRYTFLLITHSREKPL